jgi:hypothetical protein
MTEPATLQNKGWGMNPRAPGAAETEIAQKWAKTIKQRWLFNIEQHLYDITARRSNLSL